MTTPRELPRACVDCLHRNGEDCRHPQAEWHWGHFLGLDARYSPPRWPKADRGCGFFKPTEQWIARAAALARALALARLVRRDAA